MIIELLSKRQLIDIVKRHTYRCIRKCDMLGGKPCIVGQDYFVIVDNDNERTYLADEDGEVLAAFVRDKWKDFFKEN